MKRSLAVLLLLASGLALSAVAQSPTAPASQPATGQSGRIHGHVDGPAGVTGTVFLSGPEEHSFPISASGDYSGEAAPGSYSLVVQELDRSAGYPQLTKLNTSVDILPGKDLQLDFDRSGNPHAQMEAITTQDSGGAPSPAPASAPVQGSAPANSETVPAISFQVAVLQTDEGKRLFSDLQKKYEPKRAQLKALNDEVQAMTKQLQADSAKLSDTERSARAGSIDEKKKILDSERAEAQDEFQKEMEALYEPLASRFYQFVVSYAKQQGLPLVFDAEQNKLAVIYKADSTSVTDITKTVVASFNLNSSGTSAPQTAASPAPPGPDASTTPSSLVTSYLAAAATLNPSATRPFLSTDCHMDMFTEFKAYDGSGWKYSASDSSVLSEKDDARAGKATVSAGIVYKGGDPPTFMRKTETFHLVLENGIWKIATMDPAPETASPGYRPL